MHFETSTTKDTPGKEELLSQKEQEVLKGVMQQLHADGRLTKSGHFEGQPNVRLILEQAAEQDPAFAQYQERGSRWSDDKYRAIYSFCIRYSKKLKRTEVEQQFFKSFPGKSKQLSPSNDPSVTPTRVEKDEKQIKSQPYEEDKLPESNVSTPSWKGSGAEDVGRQPGYLTYSEADETR